jgi:hypothetical protein
MTSSVILDLFSLRSNVSAKPYSGQIEAAPLDAPHHWRLQSYAMD